MDTALWNTISMVINSKHTWVKVKDNNRQKVLKVMVNGCPTKRTSRVLRLVAVKPTSKYKKGQVWSITELNLDRALRHLRRDPQAALRLKSEQLINADLEFVIKIATYGTIDLRLSNNIVQDEYKYL